LPRLEEAVALVREAGEEREIAQTLTAYAITLHGLNQVDAAVRVLDEALEIADRLDLRLDRVAILAAKADALAVLGEGSASLQAAEESQRALVQTESLERLATVQRALALAHESMGNFEKALQFDRQAAATRDRMRNDEAERQIQEVRDQMMAREATNRARWLIAAVLTGLFLVGSLIFAHAQGRRHANRERLVLDSKLDLLEQSLEWSAKALDLASSELTRSQATSKDSSRHVLVAAQPGGTRPAEDGPTTSATTTGGDFVPRPRTTSDPG